MHEINGEEEFKEAVNVHMVDPLDANIFVRKEWNVKENNVSLLNITF